MEEQKKNELGYIYGSRISKNGKWLNLLIVTHVGGQEVRITCPVRLEENKVEGKPFAQFHLTNGSPFKSPEKDMTKAMLLYIPVYEDRKPTEEQAAREDAEIPF